MVASVEQAPVARRFVPGDRVGVVVPMPFDTPLDYVVPEGLTLAPGDFVLVELGPRRTLGVAWGPGEGRMARERLKPVLDQLSLRPMTADLRQFVERAAAYTLTPLGMMLRLATRVPDPGAQPKLRKVLDATGAVPARLTPARSQVLDAAAAMGGQGLRPADLAREAGVSSGVVQGLVQAGALAERRVQAEAPFAPLFGQSRSAQLSGAQAEAAAALREAVRSGRFSATLLYGVTGSGKTEVYLEAIAECLAAGRQALVLVPEVALTPAFLTRVETRFGARPAEWHHGVAGPERRRVWRGVAEGRAGLVVGARSALFLPFADLGLIVVDEEHESSFKQEDMVLYHARDMAVLRGSIEGAAVVLASATPSLETVLNAQEGKYSRVILSSRFGPAVMPDISVVDMRGNAPPTNEWLAEPAAAAVTETLAKGQQVLLYLNRRGYAPVTICRRCGERMTAPDSDTWLVEHRYTNRLVCHQTGFSMPKPEKCPHCGAKDTLAPCGPGVERVAEEAQARWPDARVEIFSSDMVDTPGSAKALLERMTMGEIDILVATQAAAKGHNFPGLTLVVGVDADLGLAGGDLRAAERTYQVLTQVAGRAGRAAEKGRVLLQSYQPEHRVTQALASGLRDAFFEAELGSREEIGLPPYGRMAAIILSGQDEQKVNAYARALMQAVPYGEGIEVWGPAPAPFYRLRGLYRVRFLVRGTRQRSLQAFTSDWLSRVKPTSAVRRIVDIDPYSFT